MSNYYYSGQGSLYIAERDPTTGNPKGFMAVGNVPELTLNIETTKFEHKESESGSRLIDLTIIQEKKGTFEFRLENMNLDNLALGLWGTKATVTGASVTDEAVIMSKGKRSPVIHPGISAVTVESKDGVDADPWVATTAYVAGAYVIPTVANTHYYKCTTGGTSAGTEPVTWPIDGSTVTDGTVVWKDMGLIIKSSSTDYSTDATVGAITPKTTGTFEDDRTYLVSYTYAGYTKVDAFTSAAAPERWLRFEGINTVDNTKVIVELFKAQFDPLTGYALLNEELGSVTMRGSLLADATRLTGSKFFRQVNLA
jgi:hypothetical protein